MPSKMAHEGTYSIPYPLTGCHVSIALKLEECMVLWGESDRVDVQNME